MNFDENMEFLKINRNVIKEKIENFEYYLKLLTDENFDDNFIIFFKRIDENNNKNTIDKKKTVKELKEKFKRELFYLKINYFENCLI
jgi:hypothetical protein